jgi:iron complex transport system ATP-binding protein
VISFENVSFGYGERRVVDGLTLEIPRGQLLGVIGPNGAGKSTIVRLLLGLLQPDGGRVRVDGREVSSYDRRAFARLCAAVPQEEALEFPFTALEVVLMGRIAHLGALGFEKRADIEAAHKAMAETCVEELADRPLYTLSGGERKRVLLARAIAQESPLLVLDEPAAALDIHHQIAIFDLLRERHRRGVTVVVVVHDLNLAAAYCDRLLLCRAGQPPLAGSVEEILTYQRVKESFGVDVYVGVNEITGARFLIPMTPQREK